MAKYRVTSPDGQVYEVTAPEGATRNEVLSYAERQFSQQQPPQPAAPQPTPMSAGEAITNAPQTAANNLSSIPERMVDVATNPNVAGGPIAAFGRYAYDQFSNLIDELAYKAGGKTTDYLAEKGLSPETSAKGGYAANLGTQLLAAGGIGKAGAAVGRPTMERGARSMMAASVKPLTADWEKGKAVKAIDTLLERDWNPHGSGMIKMEEAIARLKNEVDAVIANSKGMVNKAVVYQKLKKLEDALTARTSEEGVEAVRKAWNDFKNHKWLKGKLDMPVQTAQKMKRAIDQELGDKPFGELSSDLKEVKKATRWGLREGIEKAEPRVAPLNAELSEILNAKKISGRRAFVAQNNNALGLAPIAPNTLSAITFLADRSPTVAAEVANLLYRNAGVIPGGVAAAASYPVLANSAVPEESRPPLVRWLNSYFK